MKILAARIFRLPVVCAALTLAACVTPPPQNGNFSSATEDTQKEVAIDAIAQMVRVFPPAKYKLTFSQKATDTFGLAFLDGLRTTGYAIEEIAGNEDDDSAKKNQQSDGNAASYTLDDIDDILRLTIYVGQRSITKAYLKRPDGTYGGSGYWSFKE
jgi:hypothetical protein